MIWPALCFIVLGCVAGLVFGGLEGSTVVERRATGGKKLAHGRLLIGRMGVCVIAAGMIEAWTLSGLILTGLMFVALTITHRQEFNRVIGKPFWYMGPAIRGSGDANYDGIMYGIDRWWANVCRRSIRPQGAFWWATIIEVSALVGLVVAYCLQSA